MAKAEPLAPLLNALNDLRTWFKAQEIPGIVIGGVAVSLLGRPRVTRDVDALVLLDETKWSDFISSGIKYNFYPRIKDPLTFAQQSRVFLFVHKPSKIDIDISIGILPFEQNCIEKAIEVKAGGISILLPTPEDLIIMKAIAHRSRDLIDIESILDANPVLDYTYIRQSLKEFSTLLEMPEILQDFELIFNKSQKGKK